MAAADPPLDPDALAELVPDAPVVAPETAPPSGADSLHKMLWTAWRAAAGPDAPTLNQLIAIGVQRVEVDAVSGYVAVVMSDETYRAIGLRRELVAPMVAAFTTRTASEIESLLARGPARIEPAKPVPNAAD